jgi:predicted acetyltransferase
LIDIKKDNIKIIPLGLENIKLYAKNKKLLEEKLELKITNLEMSHKLKNMLTEISELMLEDKKNYLWHTNWIIILKKENIIIGGVLFKGPPNKYGEVEIGYTIDKEFRKKGYMTIVLNEMLKWAYKQKYVKAVIAETKKNNIASQKVLLKAGMEKYKETNRYFWYKIKVPIKFD